jgi:hypothetical protein
MYFHKIYFSLHNDPSKEFSDEYSNKNTKYIIHYKNFYQSTTPEILVHLHLIKLMTYWELIIFVYLKQFTGTYNINIVLIKLFVY